MKLSLLILVFSIFLTPAGSFGQIKPQRGTLTESPVNAAGSPRYGILNINNLTTWMRSDGQSNHSPKADNGLYFPRGIGNIIYQDGIVWGAKAFLDSAFLLPAPFQSVRAGGTTYGTGTRSGWVAGFGPTAQAVNPNDPDVRIYRIRRDYMTLSESELRREAADVNEIPESQVTTTQMNEIAAQYAKDWDEWPVHRGAPYIERNFVLGYQEPPAFGPDFNLDSLISQNHDEPGISGVDPNAYADQVLWTVYNDLNEAQALGLFASRPLGVEVQKTLWGYKQPGALGNVYFNRFKFVNRGGVDTDSLAGIQAGSFHLDSVYFCQWSDPDLGGFSDDLAGCDTLLQLGFAYNSRDNDNAFTSVSLPPPAVGYVLLQGPAVPSSGDTAIVDFKRRLGFRNRPLDSFATWGAGDPYSDPPNGLPGGYNTTTGQWWKIIRGFAPLGSLTTADIAYFAPPGVNPRFMHPGDPSIPNSHVDGLILQWSMSPGDRRFHMGTGPHSLHPGETSELIIAVALGLGADRLSSVKVMKANAQAARRMHELLFAGFRAPSKPIVRSIELDRQIILEWASDPVRVAQTEQDIVPGDYRFEGYNIYQLPSLNSPLEDGLKVATFDIINDVQSIVEVRFDPAIGQMNPVLLQKGENTGIFRSWETTRDYFQQFSDPRLFNGQQYYFAVTAYNHCPAFGASPPSLESEPAVITVTPQKPFGTIPSTQVGDSVSVARFGFSDGTVAVSVLDPHSTTNENYEIRFRNEPSGLVWDVVNVTQNQTIKAGINRAVSNTVADGLLISVSNPADDFKDFWEVSNNAGPHPPTYAAFQLNSSGFPTTLPANTLTPSANPQGARWGIHASTGFYHYYTAFRDTTTLKGTVWPRLSGNDLEIRFTSLGGKALFTSVPGSLIDVPFELWNVGRDSSDAADDYRMLPIINDDNGNNVFDLSGIDHVISGSSDDPQTDLISWNDPVDRSAGQGGYLAWVASNGSSGVDGFVLSKMVLVNYNGGSVSNPSFPANVNQQLPPSGTTFRIITVKPNTPADVFSFQAPSVQSGIEVQKQFAQNVGVFPNPWVGSTAINQYVTFLNLPGKATIRIFNLAGHLVRIIKKDDPSQYVQWNLTNRDNWQVASGLYICHIDMPDLGETKVLKLAVIQPQIFSPY